MLDSHLQSDGKSLCTTHPDPHTNDKRKTNTTIETAAGTGVMSPGDGRREDIGLPPHIDNVKWECNGKKGECPMEKKGKGIKNKKNKKNKKKGG